MRGILVGLVLLAGCSSAAVKAQPPVTQVVSVSFKVISGYWDFQALKSGDVCTGENVSAGYNDITNLTPVEVSTIGGKVLARAELGQGSTTMQPSAIDPVNEFDPHSCDFTTRLTVEKGSDGGKGFVVSVGDRGSTQKTWAQLADGVALTLGD